MCNTVLLIRPRNIYNYNNYPSLGFICLGSVLENAGYDVKIVNCAFEKNPLEVIGKQLDGVLFVGVTLLTSEVPHAYQILKHIKAISDVPTIVGGWHCTLFPEQMSKCDYVDYVVAGEGEEHILDIAEAFRNDTKPDKTIYRKEILDIQQLPRPNYDLDEHIESFVSSYLTDKFAQYVTGPMRWLPYESSRGCPSRCAFCINTVTNNRRYRKKDAEKVLSEIEHLVDKYRLTHLKFIDDNFFVDIERVRKICSGIVDRKLDITWDGECRCDYFRENMLNDDTLELAKRSGLVQLTMGIESGSEHSLELMKKDITPSQALFAVAQCDKHGIIARSSFILDIPGENLSDIKQTVSFVNKLRKYKHFACGVGTFRPYPKCELTAKLLADGCFDEPQTFKEWTDKNVIDMYTSAEYIRPWQINGKYSARTAMYLNMESATRLGNHQISSRIDKFVNSVFIFLATVRNRMGFYELGLDEALYAKFIKRFYRRKQESEKAEHEGITK